LIRQKNPKPLRELGVKKISHSGTNDQGRLRLVRAFTVNLGALVRAKSRAAPRYERSDKTDRTADRNTPDTAHPGPFGKLRA
jgi:hypothetical protein